MIGVEEKQKAVPGPLATELLDSGSIPQGTRILNIRLYKAGYSLFVYICAESSMSGASISFGMCRAY